MAVKKFIDVAYLQSFWTRIKGIPRNSNYSVTPTGKSAINKTLLGHIQDLYEKAASVDGAVLGVSYTGAETNKLLSITTSDHQVSVSSTEYLTSAITKANSAVQSVTKATGAYSGLTVSSKDANNGIEIGLDLSAFGADTKDDILDSITAASNGGLEVTKTETANKTTAITIGIDSTTLSTIGSALQSVAIDSSYLAGDGTVSSPIAIDSAKIQDSGSAVNHNKLATKGYVDSQISAFAGVTSISAEGGDVPPTYNVTVDSSKGDVTIGLNSDAQDALALAASAIQSVIADSSTTNAGYLTVGTSDGEVTISLDASGFELNSNKVNQFSDTDSDDSTNYATVGAIVGYVNDKIDAIPASTVTVTGGKSSAQGATLATFAKDGNTEDYYVYLTDNAGGIHNIKLNATDFVKDSFLASVELDSDTNELVFTWNTKLDGDDSEGSTTVTRVNLGDYIDVYTAGDGIDIDSSNIISVKTAGYITFDSSNVVIDSTLIQDAGSATGHDKLATKGYVDSQIGGINITSTDSSVTITKSGTSFDLSVVAENFDSSAFAY
jgi:hypothetical protein